MGMEGEGEALLQVSSNSEYWKGILILLKQIIDGR